VAATVLPTLLSFRCEECGRTVAATFDDF